MSAAWATNVEKAMVKPSNNFGKWLEKRMAEKYRSDARRAIRDAVDFKFLIRVRVTTRMGLTI